MSIAPAGSPPTLPKLAPLAQAANLTYTNPLESGILLGLEPATAPSGTGQQLSFISRTMSAHGGDAPRPLVGTIFAGGMGSVSGPEASRHDGPAFRSAVADAASAIATLGREVPASTFDSADGVAKLLASIRPTEAFVQTWSNGTLTTRVLDGEAEIGDAEAAIQHALD